MNMLLLGAMVSSVAICRSHWRRPDIGLAEACIGRCAERTRSPWTMRGMSIRAPGGDGSPGSMRSSTPSGSCGIVAGGVSMPSTTRRPGRSSPPAGRDPGLGARCGCRCRESIPPEQAGGGRLPGHAKPRMGHRATGLRVWTRRGSVVGCSARSRACRSCRCQEAGSSRSSRSTSTYNSAHRGHSSGRISAAILSAGRRVAARRA
jgi:hypothetical protein